MWGRQAADQVAGVDIERLGEFEEGVQPWLLFASLEPADLVAVNSGPSAQLSL